MDDCSPHVPFLATLPSRATRQQTHSSTHNQLIIVVLESDEDGLVGSMPVTARGRFAGRSAPARRRRCCGQSDTLTL